MNVDDSRESDPSEVRSKYFTSQSAMDESLSDFQEPKKSSTGPKSTAKAKNKPKKAPKRIRGQKDIRTALKSKKNDLESYSEAFDKVCKKAGLDIDSEQLQLAIALSKSLQETGSTSSEPSENIQVLNTQAKIGKIRTTLREYGFKVPEIKIASNTRRQKKLKKNYKLISTSETEKKEITANKYSQILFQDITHCSLYYCDTNSTDIPLYYLATNVPYTVMKKIDTFYVNNLIEKSTSKGNSLRDWSEIPGRPVSPKLFEPSNMDFSEIDCSQDELDVVLSGTLKSCKNVLSNENKDLFSDKSCKVDVDTDVNNLNIEKNIAVIGEVNIIDHNKTFNNGTVISISTDNRCRSCSPDLFDDDASSIIDCNTSKNSTIQHNNPAMQNISAKTELNNVDLAKCIHYKSFKSQNCTTSLLHINSDLTRRKSNDLMDITECVLQSKNFVTVISKPDSGLILSQNTNVTKRKTNDFMEITECVPMHSQPIKNNNIDLTQSPDYIQENIVSGEAALNQKGKITVVNSKSKISLKVTSTSSTKDSDVILLEAQENLDVVEINNEIPNMLLEGDLDKSIESMDLTQSSNTSDELPFVSLTTKDKTLDRTVIVNYDIGDINKRKKRLEKEADAHIDLTQNVYIGAGNENQSFFEEFNHDHSDNAEPTGNNSKSKEQSQTDEHVTQSEIGGHSNSQRVSGCIMNDESDSEFDDVTRSNTEKTRANNNLHEQSLPVEYHRCNITELRPLTGIGNVDLTQNIPETELQSEKRYRSKCSGESNSSTAESSPSLARNLNNDSIIIEEVPVEKLPCNFGFWPPKPGKVDLTQSAEENVCPTNYKCSRRRKIKSTRCFEENSSISSQNKSDTMDYCLSQENESPTTHERSNDDGLRQEKGQSYLNSKQSKADSVNISISPIKHNNNKINDMDLTQSSNSSVELSQAFSYNASKGNEIDNNIPEEITEPTTSKNSQRCSSLGRKDDVSIDYDDVINSDANLPNSSKNASLKSINHEDPNESFSKLSKNNSFASNCSQNSEVFEISDKELDYSLHQSKLEVPRGNFVFGGISIMDDLSNLGMSKKSSDLADSFAINNNADVIEVAIDNIPIATNEKLNRCKEISPIKHRRVTEIATPQKAGGSMFTVVTPKNSELIIKTNNVTPMLDYESMSMEEIHNELDKFGIKPFKRKRAIQLLTHIYNQTHPIIEELTDEVASPPKRHKPNEQSDLSPTKVMPPRKILSFSRDVEEFVAADKCRNVAGTSKDYVTINKGKENSKRLKPNDQLSTSPRKRLTAKKNLGSGKDAEVDFAEEYRNVPGTSKDAITKSKQKGKDVSKEKKGKRTSKNSLENEDNQGAIDIIDRNDMECTRRSKDTVFGDVSSHVSIEIACKPEDWVFQKREKAKVHSCRVPLHIAFHNYVLSRRDLREAILCYEPVEIDVIHKDLVAYGHRYDPKDLLKYLDKKCITVKTTDNDARNSKR